MHAYEGGDLFDLAASYAFHIAKNHPFVDGNKRTGLQAALAFLILNGVTVPDPTQALYDAVMGFMDGSCDKPRFAALLRAMTA